MINPGHKILTAWFELLNGNLSVPVYRTDAPVNAPDKYVILRMESGTDRRNNQANVTNPVLITEVVTKYDVMINDADIFEIDTEIGLLLSSTPATHNLPIQPGIQITSVIRQNETILPEDDGSRRINTLITRNIHRVVQTPVDIPEPGIGVFVVS